MSSACSARPRRGGCGRTSTDPAQSRHGHGTQSWVRSARVAGGTLPSPPGWGSTLVPGEPGEEAQGDMELGLAGRTAIVCGASSGMGLAIAESLAAEGANVAMFARRRELLDREAERIGGLPVRGDLTNAADLERLLQPELQALSAVRIPLHTG